MPQSTLLVALACLTASSFAANLGERVLGKVDGSLVTTAFASTDGKTRLLIESEEFLVRLEDGATFTARDFAGEELAGAIEYSRVAGRVYPEGAPTRVRIESHPRVVTAFFDREPKVALLEPERFRVRVPAERGGRGEPVVLDGRWVLLPWHPTTLTRHTDGNEPSAYSRRFEKVGNHSFVGFEKADIDPISRPGLVRAIEFAPAERQADGAWVVRAHGFQVLLCDPGESPEMAVLDLAPRPLREFTHYNNWFDGSAKAVGGETLPRITSEFGQALQGTGIKVASIVPDNGWQDRTSVWQPSKGHFPDGMDGLSKLGRRLREQGTSLGLWVSPDMTTNNIGWAEKAGYAKAKPNAYFSQYFPHVSLADPAYNRALREQLGRLVTEAKVNYFKFDFNHLSNVNPTDRHGHVGEFRGLAGVIDSLPKDVFLNVTNWTWHSPAWRNFADSVWLLAGDDGFNGNWPELAGRAQSTTDRDLFFWRMWGDPKDRPWYPIASIMTHGIIRNPRGQMSFKTDTLQDWCDYVLMHYGRGTLLREWYFLPGSLTPEEWKSLIAVHRWTDSRRADLINSTYVGGRPDEGRAYGFVGWSRDGKTGTLVARNPSPADQILRVPLDASTLFRAASGQAWTGTQVYPARTELAQSWTSGEAMEITLPGYATVALELRPGRGVGPVVKRMPSAVVKPGKAVGQAQVTPASFVDGRCELLVIGRPTLPAVLIDGKRVAPLRRTRGAINQFPSYAKDGMPTPLAEPWEMASYNLADLRGKEVAVRFEGRGTVVEAHTLTEVADGSPVPKDRLTPLTLPGHRRETLFVYAGPAAPTPPLAPDAWAKVAKARLDLEVFGNNGDTHGDKVILLNGAQAGILPTQGDSWKTISLPIAGPALDALRSQGPAAAARITMDKDRGDFYKVRGLRLVLTLADGSEWTGDASGALTTLGDWPHAEGRRFMTPTDSGPIPLGN
jgi:hypothetical protein